jgi:hypothetical protein
MPHSILGHLPLPAGPLAAPVVFRERRARWIADIQAIKDGRLCPTDREAALARLWRRVAELDEFLVQA